MLGKAVVTDDPLHEKSPLNYLPQDSQFEYFGSCTGKTSSRSDVRVTPISKHVTEVTGVENIWGKPKMKPEWFGWQTALANASHTGIPFPHKILRQSILDYKEPLLELASMEMWQSQPLSDHENLCGRVGCKFIDSINLATSIGYPLTGPKRNYVIELEPTEEKPNNKVFDPVVMDEIKRVEDCYRRGERAYTIAKACKKDEVLPVAKGKCRIFYGNPIALTWLVRKYFLPINRFLQMNPLVAECAVGINCHGPDWTKFYQHATAFGTERLFGGDYGKYDQRMPSQLILAALRIMIDIARVMGYEQEHLDIMSAMAGDIVYSMVAVNGDLIGLQTGTHISGNSLTVIINSVCGSLNLRNYYYERCKTNGKKFREAAHIMTYGDDNIGTVHRDHTDFNIKGCSEYLAEYGQVYTMPDKESELKPYLNPDEFEFLKRFNVYHEELEHDLGALLDKSIFKSLHCYMRPKGCALSQEEACAQNIDGALREWFNHGRDVYETRRSQMREIASRAGLTHMCTMLEQRYEDQVVDWQVKYQGREVDQEENMEFTTQSGSEIDNNQYAQAISDVPFKPIGLDYPFMTFGELDLVFQRTHRDKNLYVIVEVKRTSNSNTRHKARKQLSKWAAVFELLAPTSGFIYATYVGGAWEIVGMQRYTVGELAYMVGRAQTPFTMALAETLL